MKLIKGLQNRVSKFVKNKGGVLPKLFVWIFASIFIGCGVLTIVGILYEFFMHGSVNYKAVNEFIREYFSPSTAATFGIIGVLLIDRDRDGVPDEWQQKTEKEDEKHDLH